MPFGRAGKKAAAAAAAGIRPSSTRYMGLLTGIGISGRDQEASGSGYSRQAVTFTEGTSPLYAATQSGSETFTFNADHDDITGVFIAASAAPPSNDNSWQEDIIAYATFTALENIGNGSTVEVQNGVLRTS